MGVCAFFSNFALAPPSLGTMLEPNREALMPSTHPRLSKAFAIIERLRGDKNPLVAKTVDVPFRIEEKEECGSLAR